MECLLPAGTPCVVIICLKTSIVNCQLPSGSELFCIVLMDLDLPMACHASGGPVFSLAREKTGEKRVLGDGTCAAVQFRQETNLIASAITPSHFTGASVRAARWSRYQI